MAPEYLSDLIVILIVLYPVLILRLCCLRSVNWISFQSTIARLETGICKVKKTDVSLLHERCQALKLPQPEEVTVWQRTPKKGQLFKPLFKIRYFVAGKAYSPGKASNKQAAREKAAKLALNEMEKRNVPKIVLGKTNSMFDR